MSRQMDAGQARKLGGIASQNMVELLQYAEREKLSFTAVVEEYLAAFARAWKEVKKEMET